MAHKAPQRAILKDTARSAAMIMVRKMLAIEGKSS